MLNTIPNFYLRIVQPCRQRNTSRFFLHMPHLVAKQLFLIDALETYRCVEMLSIGIAYVNQKADTLMTFVEGFVTHGKDQLGANALMAKLGKDCQ